MLIKSDESIVVVCAADDNYAMPLAVMARSIVENLSNNWKLILFIVDGGIKDCNKQKILKSLHSEKCEIHFIPKPEFLLHEIEAAYNHLQEKEDATGILKHLSSASYYRLLISELLPNQFEKAIYLDCDLVVNGRLDQLWRSELGENYVLAVQDTLIRYVSNHLGLLNYKELNIPASTKYFNAGVLVINLKKWRDDGITTRAIEYLKQNIEYIRFHDQDILNALLADQWGELDPRWNLLLPHALAYSSWKESPFSEDVYNTLIQNPYIIHYASELKPWNSRHPRLKEHFFHYVDTTAWSGWRLTLWRRVWITSRREFRKAIRRINN